VRKKRTHKGSYYAILLSSAAFLAIAALIIVNSINSKDSFSRTKDVPYGTPEYVIELPPGYEDLAVIPPEERKGKTSISKRTASDLDIQAGAEEEIKKAGSEKLEPYSSAGPPSALPGSVAQPTLIIVIDDVGYNNGELNAFLQLPFPITLAVLPQLPHSNDSVAAIHQAGKELILHQPMEALGGNDPGPHAVYCSMDEATIEKTVAENIDSFPYPPAGMNNHMGSAVTRDSNCMIPILKLTKERGIYYLNSLTAPGTVCAELSQKIGTQYMERDVFLDNNSDRESILAAIEEGKQIARQKGAAVMIGHVWSSKLASTLMEIYPELVEQGYSLSTISQYMKIQAKENLVNENFGD